MIKFDDVSIECILSELFDQKASFESDEIDKELAEELTEEEQEILDGPTDEEDGADETELAEESARLYGEVRLMDMAMHTAEEFIWSRSEEAEGEKGYLKKFWAWLKQQLEKLSMFLITAFKRFQVWLAGDMRRIVEWAKKNDKQIEEGIKTNGYSITRKIVYLKEPFSVILNKLPKYQPSLISKAIISLNAGKGDPDTVTLMKELTEKLSMKEMKDSFYGKDAKAEDVTLARFDNFFPIKQNLSDKAISKIKNRLKRMQDTMKDCKKAIDVAKKEVDPISDDQAKSMKELASASYKFINALAYEGYWVTQLHVKLVKEAYMYAKQAAASSTKKEDNK